MTISHLVNCGNSVQLKLVAHETTICLRCNSFCFSSRVRERRKRENLTEKESVCLDKRGIVCGSSSSCNKDACWRKQLIFFFLSSSRVNRFYFLFELMKGFTKLKYTFVSIEMHNKMYQVSTLFSGKKCFYSKWVSEQFFSCHFRLIKSNPLIDLFQLTPEATNIASRLLATLKICSSQLPPSRALHLATWFSLIINFLLTSSRKNISHKLILAAHLSNLTEESLWISSDWGKQLKMRLCDKTRANSWCSC